MLFNFFVSVILFVVDSFWLRELVDILIFVIFFMFGWFCNLELNFFSVINFFFGKNFFFVNVVYKVGVVWFFDRINLFLLVIFGFFVYMFILLKYNIVNILVIDNELFGCLFLVFVIIFIMFFLILLEWFLRVFIFFFFCYFLRFYIFLFYSRFYNFF